VRFEVALIDDDLGAPLIAALLADLMDRYGVEDLDEPAPVDLAPPGGVFLVACTDTGPVGCGGIRSHAEGVAELKRMYVVPAARRDGVARTLLEQLEQHAVALGYSRIRLETGVRQPEAIALYESAGYEPIDRYGHYQASSLSRCFEKELATGRAGQGTS
jgi:GNAT superfamily N-acetyltransferase